MNHFLQSQKEEIFRRFNTPTVHNPIIDKASFDRGFEACASVMQDLLDKKDEEIHEWFDKWKTKTMEQTKLNNNV